MLTLSTPSVPDAIPDRLVDLVRSWSKSLLWDATWKLMSDLAAARAVRREDDEYQWARARVAELAAKLSDRLGQLEEIEQLVEHHAPDLLGQVPERPWEPPFDHPTARRLGQEMRTVLGLLLARRKASGQDTSAPPLAEEAEIGRKAKERAAVAALLEIGPNANHISKLIGVPRTTLLGWKMFRENYDKLKADAKDRKKKYRGRRAGAGDYSLDDD